MKRLSPKEEQIMQILWDLDKAFVKEVREKLPAPKPHINTVSTIIRRLVDKGFLKYDDFGSTYRYYPVITRKKYRQQFLNEKVLNYFNNSYKEMVAYFAREEKISLKELKEIIKMIESGDKK